eukprot:jgi/Picsp_1/5296/NSC_02657-R1_hypothetical protein CHLNCDRAFT_58394 [Chlorella variabilis]
MRSFKCNLIFAIVALLAICVKETFARVRNGHASANVKSLDNAMSASGTCSLDKSVIEKRWQEFYAVINEKDFKEDGGSGICGKCVRVRGVAEGNTRTSKIGTVYAKVVDVCSSDECKKGEIGFSQRTIDTFARYSWDSSRLKWDVVPCPERSNLRG